MKGDLQIALFFVLLLSVFFFFDIIIVIFLTKNHHIMINKILSYLFNLIFPTQCINCDKKWEYLCKDCKKKLVPHPEICPYCHRFSTDYQTCINCKPDRKNNFLEGIIITFSYCWLLKKLILKLKYFHKKDIWDFLSQRLAIIIQTNQILQNSNSKILISSVPSHRFRKYFIKWYNQSEILAKNLSKQCWLPYINMWIKTKYTSSQAWLNRNKRLSNLINTFNIKNKNIIKWDETIIIIDDITTTWATINELAKTIKTQYPQSKIWWLVIWRSNN